MDALQFGLFFVALLVGYVLVHLRLVRFEDHLEKLAGIRGLDDRLRALDERLRLLTESFDKLRLERIESQLDRLHEDLEDLREATTEVQHAVVQIPQPVVTTTSAAPTVVEIPALPPSESAATRILTAVENRLLQLGYHRIHVLTDLRDARAENELELMVECERGSMPVKGRVLVRNGAVRDVALQTVVQMFP